MIIASWSLITFFNNRFFSEKIERTFNVNVLAHFWTIKSFLPEMINNKKGHIVTVASLAGHSGTNKLVDYCSSKFANVGMDEALKAELFVQGYSSFIKTTVVCPYYISTGMFEGVASKVNSSKLKILLRILVISFIMKNLKYLIFLIFRLFQS